MIVTQMNFNLSFDMISVTVVSSPQFIGNYGLLTTDYGLIPRVVVSSGRSRLLRRRQERELILERNVV